MSSDESDDFNETIRQREGAYERDNSYVPPTYLRNDNSSENCRQTRSRSNITHNTENIVVESHSSDLHVNSNTVQLVETGNPETLDLNQSGLDLYEEQENYQVENSEHSIEQEQVEVNVTTSSPTPHSSSSIPFLCL